MNKYVNTLFKGDGVVLVGHESCREGLAEYFDELYYVHPPAEILAGGAQRVVVVPDMPFREDPPSCQEVKRVVSKLKGAEFLGLVGFLPSCPW